MVNEKNNLISCSDFENSLSDYLDKMLEPTKRAIMAEHAMSCPLCNALMSEVKKTIAACHEIAEPAPVLTRLEAQIIQNTSGMSAFGCEEFEEHLTDYLDGFLPANVFHRWEHHAALCQDCSDLPGAVVRSLGEVVTYKLEELPIPAGLNEKILMMTIGTEEAAEMRSSFMSRLSEWIRSVSLPLSIPQMAPVAMMLVFALFFISQTVSADGTLTGVYTKGFQLAEMTYQQNRDAFRNTTPAGEETR